MNASAPGARRPRIAATINTVQHLLHGQHFLDRLLDGYGWNGAYQQPRVDLVSLYVDQTGVGDLSAERAARHPSLKICPTIYQALTLGTGKLAVEGVVLIAEDGLYPRNEKGQPEFPRYQFFEQIVDVFRLSNRAVPVYIDKHLSWRWDWAKAMYDTARAMHFPIMAGSSLPVTWRLPSVEMPLGAPVREAVCVGWADSIQDEVDSYDFHALETIQCMVERRRGGESGVEWVQAFRGENFWRAYADGLWSPALVRAALCRSLTLTPGLDTFSDMYPNLEQMRAIVKNPLAYHYGHRDGLRSTMILFDGLLRDFNFAASIDGQVRPFSTQMYLPIPDRNRTTLASFFSPLTHLMEDMFLTGEPPYPVERTLLTNGILIAGIDSLFQAQGRVPTPHLAIAYQPNPESTFWRS